MRETVTTGGVEKGSRSLILNSNVHPVPLLHSEYRLA